MKFASARILSRLAVVAGAMLLSLASARTSLALPFAFSEPTAWTVGDLGSTSQLWIAGGTSALAITTNLTHSANPNTATPTLVGSNGAFVASSGGFYSFSTNYRATATVPSTGLSGPGTSILVQAAASLNPDYDPEGNGTGGSVLRNSIQVLDASNNLLATIDPSSVTRTYYDPAMMSSFGEVQYEELLWEIDLPGYTGDFKVVFDIFVHSSLQALRIDATTAAVPEPGTLVLLGTGLLGLTVAGLRGRRRAAR